MNFEDGFVILGTLIIFASVVMFWVSLLFAASDRKREQEDREQEKWIKEYLERMEKRKREFEDWDL